MVHTSTPPVSVPVRFFSRVAGSRYIFKNGTEALFIHGFYDVKDQQELNELNELTEHGNPLIFRDPAKLEKLDHYVEQARAKAKAEKEILSEDQTLSQLTAGKVTKVQQETGGQVGTGQPTDVNMSTVDPQIQAAILGNASGVNTSREQMESPAVTAAKARAAAALPRKTF